MNFKCHINTAEWRMRRGQWLRVKGGHVCLHSPMTLCYLCSVVSVSPMSQQSSAANPGKADVPLLQRTTECALQ